MTNLTEQQINEIAEAITSYPIDGTEALEEAATLAGFDTNKIDVTSFLNVVNSQDIWENYVDAEGNVINGGKLVGLFVGHFTK